MNYPNHGIDDMSRLKYVLTLTCEAGTPEELLKLLDFKKADLRPLTTSLEQIATTFECSPATGTVTLAGSCPGGRYFVTAARVSDAPQPTKPKIDSLEALKTVDQADDQTGDKPQDCQAEGSGGNCGGLGRCDQTGPCAKGGTGD